MKLSFAEQMARKLQEDPELAMIKAGRAPIVPVAPGVVKRRRVIHTLEGVLVLQNFPSCCAECKAKHGQHRISCSKWEEK
jgi:hypothetical protein